MATFDEIDWDKFNQDAKAFSNSSEKKFISTIIALNIIETSDLLESMKTALKLEFGIASKISYKFARHGVFVEKGVGRGWPIERIKNNTAIVSSAGKGRAPKPWFNPLIEKEAARLADILVKDLADASIKNLFIR